MKLYRISQSENNGYDTYDSAVVAAMSEDEARNIHPSRNRDEDNDNWEYYKQFGYSPWCSTLDKVEVTYLGEAAEGIASGIILASYNAG